MLRDRRDYAAPRVVGGWWRDEGGGWGARVHAAHLRRHGEGLGGLRVVVDPCLRRGARGGQQPARRASSARSDTATPANRACSARSGAPPACCSSRSSIAKPTPRPIHLGRGAAAGKGASLVGDVGRGWRGGGAAGGRGGGVAGWRLPTAPRPCPLLLGREGGRTGRVPVGGRNGWRVASWCGASNQRAPSLAA